LDVIENISAIGNPYVREPPFECRQSAAGAFSGTPRHKEQLNRLGEQAKPPRLSCVFDDSRHEATFCLPNTAPRSEFRSIAVTTTGAEPPPRSTWTKFAREPRPSHRAPISVVAGTLATPRHHGAGRGCNPLLTDF